MSRFGLNVILTPSPGRSCTAAETFREGGAAEQGFDRKFSPKHHLEMTYREDVWLFFALGSRRD